VTLGCGSGVLGELLEEGWNERLGDVEMRQGMKSYDIRYREGGGERLRRENCVHEASMMFWS
jgi:hypothetical protein